MKKSLINILSSFQKINPTAFWGFACLVVGTITAILMINSSSQRDLTDLENILFQIITLGLSTLGSFLIGRLSVKKSAQELLEPYAKSAIRRLSTLYRSLQRIAQHIQDSKDEKSLTLKIVEYLIIELIQTSDDALSDWKDVAPQYLPTLNDGKRNNET